MNIREAIKQVVTGENLTQSQMSSVFNQIMGGKATQAQIGAFLIALHMKTETVDEITSAARVMRKKARKIKVVSKAGCILDTCGTGGAAVKTFNVSTTASFVLAGCGVKVAKHGNRAASSRCGSADVLEGLGVKLDVPIKVVEKCINTIGIGFLFAPLFHGAMRYAIRPRKEIGVRTIFNILGPLCNPASAKCQVLGVFDEKLTEPIAKVLKKLGSKHVYVVHGAGPLDEVTITGRTKVSELKNGKVKSFYVTPSTFGVKKASFKDIKGGSVKENVKIVRNILKGAKGPARDIVLVNSSVALMAVGKVKGFKEGVRMAAASIDSGKALEKLKKLIELTND